MPLRVDLKALPLAGLFVSDHCLLVQTHPRYFPNMIRRDALISLVLVWLLTLTSVTVGMAKGAAPAVGLVDLCIHGASVSVPVDASGKPTKSAHSCPDCMALKLAPPQDRSGQVLCLGALIDSKHPVLRSLAIGDTQTGSGNGSRAPPVHLS